MSIANTSGAFTNVEPLRTTVKAYHTSPTPSETPQVVWSEPLKRQFQFDFGIDHAPVKVREHGLKEAHTWPLVSSGKQVLDHAGSYRVHASEAWEFPEIELRAGNSWPSIVLDVDGSNALYRVVEAVEHGEILTPNWTVTRKQGGGTHAVWNLARPVHRGEAARPSPLKALARVSEFYADTLKADAGYNGVLSHNPMSGAHGPGFTTNWFHREAYSLPQLGEVIPMGWRRPVVSRTNVGRNCDLFRALIRWAGKPENIVNDVLAAAHLVNQAFSPRLPDAEVAATARSVHKYRKQWVTKGRYFTPAQSRLWGKERGIKSGAARRKGTALEHDPKPWESMGISRATWYRMRK